MRNSDDEQPGVELHSSGEEDNSFVSELREELVKTLNLAQISPSVEEKQSYLTLAKEIVLYRDPTNDKKLLLEFISDICDFESDNRPSMKHFIVVFLEEFCKVSQFVLPAALPVILSVLSNDNASVVKRALVAANNLYRPALKLLCDKSYVERKEDDSKKVYETIEEIRKKALELLQGRHLACRIASTRVLQTIALSQLSPDASGPIAISGRVANLRPKTGPNAFTLLNIPRGGNAILHAAMLESNAKNVVSKMLDCYNKLDLEKATDARLGVQLTSSLSSISLQRPTVRGLIMESLLDKSKAIKEKDETLIFVQGFKSNFFPLLKVETMKDFKAEILDVLTQLGGAETAAKIMEKQARIKKKRGHVDEMDLRAVAEGTALPAEMLKQQHFSPGEALALRQMAVERIIQNCSENRIKVPRAIILARVTSDFVPPRVGSAVSNRKSKRKRTTRSSPSHPETEGSDEANLFAKQVDMRPLVLEHVWESSDSFESRLDLVIELLYHEFSYDIVTSKAESAKSNDVVIFSRYDIMFQRVLQAVREKGIPVEVYMKLILKCPRVPLDALQLVFDHCQSENKKESFDGLGALRDIISQKQALKKRCSKAILVFSVHNKKHIRDASIQLLIGTLYEENPDLQEDVKIFALAMLNTLLEPSKPDEELAHDVGIAALDDATSGTEPPEKKSKIENSTEADDGDDTVGDDGVGAELNRKLSLFIALCVHEGKLLRDLISVYSKLSDSKLQKDILCLPTLEKLVEKLGKDIGAPQTVEILGEVPVGSYGVLFYIVKCLFSLEITDTQEKATELVSSVKLVKDVDGNVVIEADVRLVAPMLGWLPREEILSHLPNLLKVEEIRDGIISILSIGKVLENSESDYVGPDELLVDIARVPITDDISVDDLVRASNECFKHSEYYTEEVLKNVLETLIEEDSIPLITMRLALMSLRLRPSLKLFLVTILQTLSDKEIWNTSTEIWNGFILIANELKMPAFPVLLRLPEEQLKQLLSSSPDMARLLSHYYKSNKDKFSNLSSEIDSLLAPQKQA